MTNILSMDDQGVPMMIQTIQKDDPEMCKQDEFQNLANGLPEYRGWRATFEYPGFIQYAHTMSNTLLMCTPDHERAGWVSIDQQDAHGRCSDSGEAPFPVRTSEALFAAVKPWLDMCQPKPHPAFLAVIAALDEMEGIDGPDPVTDYIACMELLKAEVDRRLYTATRRGA